MDNAEKSRDKRETKTRNGMRDSGRDGDGDGRRKCNSKDDDPTDQRQTKR